MTTLEHYLVQMRDGFKSLGAGVSFDDFVLRNGRSFPGRPLPARYRVRLPKMCYWNTYRLVARSKTLRYCEGYVGRKDLPIPIQHAWAIDRHDQVVDVTLQDWETGESNSHLAEYFGIVFEREHLDPSRQGSGLLNDHIGVPNLDLWYKIDPGFKELLESNHGFR